MKIVTTVWMLHSNVHVAPKFRCVYEHWAIMFEVTSITRIIGKSTCLQCKLALSTLPSFNEIWARYLEMLKWPFLPQWAKMNKIFQRGESQRYCHFPSETNLVMVKYQKLAKSVGGNWGFWIIFDFKETSLLFLALY